MENLHSIQEQQDRWPKRGSLVIPHANNLPMWDLPNTALNAPTGRTPWSTNPYSISHVYWWQECERGSLICCRRCGLSTKQGTLTPANAPHCIVPTQKMALPFQTDRHSIDQGTYRLTATLASVLDDRRQWMLTSPQVSFPAPMR